MERMLMICGEYVEILLIFAQYSIHILSNQQLVTSTLSWLTRDVSAKVVRSLIASSLREERLLASSLRWTIKIRPRGSAGWAVRSGMWGRGCEIAKLHKYCTHATSYIYNWRESGLLADGRPLSFGLAGMRLMTGVHWAKRWMRAASGLAGGLVGLRKWLVVVQFSWWPLAIQLTEGT